MKLENLAKKLEKTKFSTAIDPILLDQAKTILKKNGVRMTDFIAACFEDIIKADQKK